MLRRWWLTIVVGTIHRRNELAEPSFEPVERALDSRIHFSDRLLRSLKDSLNPIEYLVMVRLGQIDNVIVPLLKQRIHPLTLLDNQIADGAAQVFTFSREPLLKLMLHLLRDPQIKPLDQIQGRAEARFFIVVHFTASSRQPLVSCKNHSNSGCNSSIAPTFNWTDETNQVQQFQLGLLACSDTGYLQGTFAVHGLKGTPLTFTVLGNSGQGFQYDVYVTVEQLQ